MAKLIINGGIPLKGEVTPVANKNSILALIPASILCDTPTTFTNVPMSTSVRIMFDIYEKLGGKVTYIDKTTVELNPNTLTSYIIDEELAKKERASYMFLGPLLKKFGKAEIVDAGGCKLGNRPVDTLFKGLIDLGVVFTQGDKYSFDGSKMKANDKLWQLEASVTGTENLVLAAALLTGRTVIYNAACEPHVQDLCNYLVKCGAKITGIGTNKIEIEGVENIKGTTFKIISDHIDIGGLIVAAAITKGELLIKDAIPNHMYQVLRYFEKMNLKTEVRGDDIFVPGNQTLLAKRNIKGDIDKVNDLPWPGYPVDLIPEALMLALASNGSMRIYSNMYETQLMFVEELKKFNAQTIVGSPNMIVTFGETKFKGAVVNCPEIIQCAYAMFLSALAAPGKSVINNADSIFRRYPDLIEQYTKLGANLSKE